MRLPCISSCVLFTCICLCFQLQPLSAAIPRTCVGNCDSLILTNGKVWAVKNIQYTKSAVYFSYCNDSLGQILSAPLAQIQLIKRQDGQILYSRAKATSPEPKPALAEAGPVLTESEMELEKQVRQLNVMANLILPGMLLFGAGIFLAIITLVWSGQLRKAVANHPNKLALLKRIRRARRIAGITLVLLLTFGLAMIAYIIYFFSLFDKQ